MLVYFVPFVNCQWYSKRAIVLDSVAIAVVELRILYQLIMYAQVTQLLSGPCLVLALQRDVAVLTFREFLDV